MTHIASARRALNPYPHLVSRSANRLEFEGGTGSVVRLIRARWCRPGRELTIDIPSAWAAPCPDVEVVFARGTAEPPNVSGIGQVFVDSLQSQVVVGGRPVSSRRWS